MPTWILLAIACFTTVQIANFCTTIYLHRGLTHRGIAFTPLTAGVLRVILWITTAIERREWAAVHRKHHAHPDREGDPHSPLLLGFWKVQLGNVFLYRKEARNPATLDRFTKDIPPDWFDLFSGKFWWLGGVLLYSLFLALLGPLWALAALPLHYSAYILLNSTINGAGHSFGYRRYDNTATNLWFVSLLTAGEGLHNNHHAFPSDPKLTRRWWEIDPGWYGIRLLRRLRQASLT